MNRFHARLLGGALVMTTGAATGGQSTIAADRIAIRIGASGDAIRLDRELREAVWWHVRLAALLRVVGDSTAR